MPASRDASSRRGFLGERAAGGREDPDRGRPGAPAAAPRERRAAAVTTKRPPRTLEMAEFKERLFRKDDIHTLPSLACRRRCVALAAERFTTGRCSCCSRGAAAPQRAAHAAGGASEPLQMRLPRAGRKPPAVPRSQRVRLCSGPVAPRCVAMGQRRLRGTIAARSHRERRCITFAANAAAPCGLGARRACSTGPCAHPSYRPPRLRPPPVSAGTWMPCSSPAS